MIWDGVLLLVVALLSLADSTLRQEQELMALPLESPSPVASASPQAKKTPDLDTLRRNRRQPRVQRTGSATSSSSPSGLTGLLAQARELALQGKPDEALKQFAQAPDDLRQSAEWPEAQRRLQEAIQLHDAPLALLAEAQHLADQGKPQQLEALLSRLPGGADRSRFQLELEFARRRAAQGDDAFAVGEFLPGMRELSGRRSQVECDLSEQLARDLVAAVDALLALAEQLEMRDLPPLKVRLLPADHPAERGEQLLVSFKRKGEPSHELIERIRWGAASWAVSRALGDAATEAGWLRPGLTLVLAGSVPIPGDRPTLTPMANAWRRAFLARPPLGDGSALEGVMRGDGLTRDPLRAWALMFYANFSRDPGANELKQRVRNDLARLRQGVAPELPLPSQAEAAAWEPAWVAYLERK